VSGAAAAADAAVRAAELDPDFAGEAVAMLYDAALAEQANDLKAQVTDFLQQVRSA